MRSDDVSRCPRPDPVGGRVRIRWQEKDFKVIQDKEKGMGCLNTGSLALERAQPNNKPDSVGRGGREAGEPQSMKSG